MRKKYYRSGFIKAFPFLLPSLAGLVLFCAFPIVVSLGLSLTQWNGLDRINIFSGFGKFLSDNWVGFKNFADILGTREFWAVFGHTAYFIVLYIPLMLVASISVASLLNSKFKGIAAYRVLYYIPVLTSWVAGALIWKWILSPGYGAINDLLRLLGIEGPGWLQSETWAMPGIVLASIWKDMGFFGLIFLGGLAGIDPTYYEAANIDGANLFQKLTKITLPIISPVTFFIIVISIINSFQLFPQVMIMAVDAGPNGATQVMVERIYKYAFKYFQMGYAAAFSWLLFAIIFGFTMIQMKLQNKWVNYDA
jgi:multiple sugar transport system permease protein